MTEAPSGAARSRSWLPPLAATIVGGCVGGWTGYLLKGPDLYQAVYFLLALIGIVVTSILIGLYALVARRSTAARVGAALPLSFVVAALLAPIPPGGQVVVGGLATAGTISDPAAFWTGPASCEWGNGERRVELITLAFPSPAGAIVALDPDGVVWVAEEAWYLTSHHARIVDLNRDSSEGSILVDGLAGGLLISWQCVRGPGT